MTLRQSAARAGRRRRDDDPSAGARGACRRAHRRHLARRRRRAGPDDARTPTPEPVARHRSPSRPRRSRCSTPHGATLASFDYFPPTAEVVGRPHRVPRGTRRPARIPAVMESPPGIDHEWGGLRLTTPTPAGTPGREPEPLRLRRRHPTAGVATASRRRPPVGIGSADRSGTSATAFTSVTIGVETSPRSSGPDHRTPRDGLAASASA